MLRLRWLALCALCIAFLAAPSRKHAFELVFKFGSTPLDLDVGDVEAVDQRTLISRCEGKRALVVGGSRGIGRGTALALSRAGASVEVVGRSKAGGQAVVEAMRAAAAFAEDQAFAFHAADLGSVRGVLGLLTALQGRFDYVVLTVGVWPDRDEPLGPDGINKMLAVDIVGRGVLVQRLRPFLAEGARVMSVLGSAMAAPKLLEPSAQLMKGLATGEVADGGWATLLATCLLGDSLLQEAGKRIPGAHFIGTNPGIVATDLTASSNALHPVLEWLKSAFVSVLETATEEESGVLHAAIVSSPNAARRATTFFDFLGKAHEGNDAAMDEALGEWLWNFLEDFAEKHAGSKRVLYE